MASERNAAQAVRALSALLATALLVWFGTGLDPCWPLMWFAPVPVLLFALRAPAWAAALVSGFGMVLGMLNLWSLLHGTLHLPLPPVVLAYLGEGVMFALATLLFRALAQRHAYVGALLAFPALWVSFEWFLNLSSPHGTGLSLAYSQLRFLPVLQLASVTGPWGISFMLLGSAAALTVAIHLRQQAPRVAIRVLGGSVAAVLAVLVFGFIRLHAAPDTAPVKVGLVSSDGPNEDVADAGVPAQELLVGYAGAITRLARMGAAVVVLPEKTVVVLGPQAAAFDEPLQALAERLRVQLVVGVLRVVPGAGGKTRYNEARVYTPGAAVASYDKEHMLPPFESNLTPGSTLTFLHPALRAAGTTWGVAICKDMDFTDPSRLYGAAGAGLVLVPAWDFFKDWIQHGHMAVMRGVESGFSIVRSAKGGTIYASDNRGRILGETRSDASAFSTLLVAVPDSHATTVFLWAGNWFAWVAVAVLVGCLILLLARRSATVVL